MSHDRAGRHDFVLVGEQSLLIQCGNHLLARDQVVRAVVACDPRIVQWCESRHIPCLDGVDAIRASGSELGCDYLISVTNLQVLPPWLVTWPARMAINFHDGPLPERAGLNVPVWSIINGEAGHGITWHVLTEAVDAGGILVERRFPIQANETAFTLNARCYEEALKGFETLLEGLLTGTLAPRPQELSGRQYFGLTNRPAGAVQFDWRRPAADLERVVRALDFGTYLNPVMLPGADWGPRSTLVRAARAVEGASGLRAGTIQEFTQTAITVRCGEGALRIESLSDQSGNPIDLVTLAAELGLSVGHALPLVSADIARVLDDTLREVCRGENRIRSTFKRFAPAPLPCVGVSEATDHLWREAVDLGPVPEADVSVTITAVAILLARISNADALSCAYFPRSAQRRPGSVDRYVSSTVPLWLETSANRSAAMVRGDVARFVSWAEKTGGYLRDLPARDPELRKSVPSDDAPVRIACVDTVSESKAKELAGASVLTVVVAADGRAVGLLARESHVDATVLAHLAGSVSAICRQLTAADAHTVGSVDIVSEESHRLLATWNKPVALATPDSRSDCIHDLFEAQARKTPDRDACVFEGERLSYRQLNEKANQLARHLVALGVRRGDRVGIKTHRSDDTLVALFATMKTAAAYVPLDPQYPAGRVAFMAADAGLKCVITHRALVDAGDAHVHVCLDELEGVLRTYSVDDLHSPCDAGDLAYIIYTSGSTGQPKGVMVEHRHVVNFFAGMDEVVEPGPGVWLAVTSISFDISVLELFWTLARGFTVVLYADQTRLAAPTTLRPALRRRLEFGLFYWNVATDASEHDTDKYRLLLESARFADERGFVAVWTPERHFESFGGLFPNPAVTSAALAAITTKVGLRAGSCVVPLHSPIRIAEEWAVVDNLSNGRVGVSIASGWAAPDFALKPENFADAKNVMFESAETVRRLWRGESVSFPGPKGEVKVRTRPRPIQAELPIWVTTAGNLETFVQAGRLGANLLTHLLGQTFEDVAAKVKAYRQAWTEAGHPGRGVVTLMLHTFVGPDPAAVAQVVRGPLKEYLRSATALVKAAAWQFPAFKSMSEAQGKSLDEFFATVSEEDMDALLEFAFSRYFSTSGLFGTVEHCLKTLSTVESSDVDEVACLIDFGIAADTVLEHLPYLDELRAAAQARGATGGEEHSVPALLSRHHITHFQCTPTMARMLAGDASSRPLLAPLKHMMVGGEALPVDLARQLSATVTGRVSNMYGPTETTIWSAAGDVRSVELARATSVSIGTPLFNQTVHVVDATMRPVPPGVVGELAIGGLGVARGYWQRPELTRERFANDVAAPGGRLYRTGDLGRHLPDGKLQCLGRIDQQVKIRGYRIELGEIETLLRQHPGVAEAAVTVREDVPGDQRLVAYVSAGDSFPVNVQLLRESLQASLPGFMVPQEFVCLQALPLTPNGKLDRKALPAPSRAVATPAPTQAPAGGMESLVADIWKKALGVQTVGLTDNFFDIGGHSLLVVQVLKDLRETTGQSIQMVDLFRYTTIDALARFLTGSDASTVDGRASVGSARASARKAALERRVHG